jgi:hypothetical protein
MATLLLALITTGLACMSAFVSALTIALGSFVVASPEQAARIWGSRRLEKLAPESKARFISWYRVFGIFLLLGGALFAVDLILWPHSR